MARRAEVARTRFIRYLGVGFVALFMTSHLAIAQNDDAKLLDVIVAAPKLNLQRAEFGFQPALAATSTDVLRSVSCVAVDRRGYVFVIQRGVLNPIIVADPAGKVVASWGENLFKIPHTIRVDPEGNVWTVDAESSIVYKFTPQGRQLLQINVGGQPTDAPPRRNPTGGGPALVGQFWGTTDIAFGPMGKSMCQTDMRIIASLSIGLMAPRSANGAPKVWHQGNLIYPTRLQ